MATGQRRCGVTGCTAVHEARGYCRQHYARMRRYGNPLGGKFTRATGTEAERFWQRVDRSGDCWLWTGSPDANGYGRFVRDGGAIEYVHRVAYQLLVGPIPDGLTVDHLCFTRMCVRPEHLESVTNEENARRGALNRWHGGT